jgi:Carboxypeptidase regulatory-like domain
MSDPRGIVAGSTVMGSGTIAAACALVAGLAISPIDARAQAIDRARIVGTVTDSSGAMLPGVTVTLTTDGSNQSQVSDAAGAFAFSDLETGASYRVTAELPGFKTADRSLSPLSPGESAHVDFWMNLNLCGGNVDYIRQPWDDRFLTADAIVHVRTGEVVHRTTADEFCEEMSEAPAAILGVVHTSHADWRVGTNVSLVSQDDMSGRLETDTEYLLLLNYSTNSQEVFVDAMFKVSNGRTHASFLGASGDGPIAETLTALRLAYERNTRYRRYDDLRETPFETLRYKTGWVDPEDTSVIILGYGATGEARRNDPPPPQNDYPGLKDSTGRLAQAGHPYTVADVRVVESSNSGPSVWVRLVGGR